MRVYKKKFIIGAILLAMGCAFFIIPKAYADGAWGDSGSAAGGSGGAGYWTSNGFGWKLYDVDSGGPSGGFKNGTWPAISNTCRSLGDNKVWAHVVRNPRGQEKSYTYDGASYNRNRPAAGGDPYMYDANGNYSPQGAAYQQRVIDIVTRIQGYYLEANPTGSGWGISIGWFCWSDNPPWTISVSSSADRRTAEIGNTITWTHRISNDGGNRTNKTVNWHYENKGDLPSGSGGSWSFNRGSGSGTGDAQTSSYTVKPSDFGKVICRSTKAQPKSNTSSGAIESSAACVTIVKYPKIQVLGGDVRAVNATGTGQVSTWVSSQDGKYYGSWSEYGILSTGSVKGMASASGLAGGVTSTDCLSLNLLTFAHAKSVTSPTCSPTTLGSFSIALSSTLLALTARLAPTPRTPPLSGTVDVAALASQTIYSGNGTITLTASNSVLPKGKWLVINAPEATVRITNNLTYTTDILTSINEIPQLVIIAKNIIIADTVTQVDAWLLAKGSGVDGLLNTCDASGITEPAQLTARVCNNKLVINGPVMANRILLYRTAGAAGNGAPGDPAEVFNTRPDAYMWASNLPINNKKARTTLTKELPPRF